MEEFANELIDYLLPQNDVFLYVLLFASAVIENIFPPIPGDTITGLGAFLVGTGRLNYWLVYALTTAGSTIGFMTLFLVGRFLGYEFFEKKRLSFFSKKSILSALSWFGKYGCFVVIANRFLPGIRSVISIAAGMLRLNPLYVAAAALLSAAVWNFIWIEVGYSLGNNWDIVKEKLGIILRNYNVAAGVIILLIILFFAVRFFKKRGSPV